ncbi:hypothetical protein [Streptomyces sp. NPDC029041]
MLLTLAAGTCSVVALGAGLGLAVAAPVLFGTAHGLLPARATPGRMSRA